jgi:hypothetical protein
MFLIQFAGDRGTATPRIPARPRMTRISLSRLFGGTPAHELAASRLNTCLPPSVPEISDRLTIITSEDEILGTLPYDAGENQSVVFRLSARNGDSRLTRRTIIASRFGPQASLPRPARACVVESNYSRDFARRAACSQRRQQHNP